MSALSVVCSHVFSQGMDHLLCSACEVKWKTPNVDLVNLLRLPYCTTSAR